MPIIVACPSCGTRMRAPEDMIGKDVKCARCATVFPAIEGADPSPITTNWTASQPLPSTVPGKTYSFADPQSQPENDREEVEPPSRQWLREDEDDDSDDRFRRRRRRRTRMEKNIALSVVSLVLGSVSIPLACLCALLSIPAALCAVVTGGIGYKNENAKGLAIGGIVLGAISLFLTLASILYAVAKMNRGY